MSKQNDGGPHDKNKCSPELIEKVCTYIKIGAYVETAFAFCGVAPSTYKRWLKGSSSEEHPDYKPIYAELRAAIDQAIAEAEIRDLNVIDKVANGAQQEYERYPKGTINENGMDVSGHVMLDGKGNPIIKRFGTPPNWNAAAFRLTRRNPKRWGVTDASKAGGGNDEKKPIVRVTMPSNGREAPKKKDGTD